MIEKYFYRAAVWVLKQVQDDAKKVQDDAEKVQYDAEKVSGDAEKVSGDADKAQADARHSEQLLLFRGVIKNHYPETRSKRWALRNQVIVTSFLLITFTALSPISTANLPQEPAEVVLELRRAQKQAAWGGYLQLARMISGAQEAVGIVDHRMSVVVIASDLVGCVPILCWQLLFLFLWLLLLWRIVPWWRQRRYARLIVLSGVILVSGWVTWYAAQQRNSLQAVAIQSLTLRAGPSERYAQLGSLPGATTVHILDSQGNGAKLFYKVQAGTQRGWASHTDMVVI